MMDVSPPPAIVFQVPSRAIDHSVLVLAIEDRENGHWTAPGGRACWSAVAWREESSLPYRLASNRHQSRILMKQRLAKFAARFTHDGIEVTVWRLATAWYRGYDGALRARRTVDDYGSLVEGIYGQLSAGQDVFTGQ